VRCAKGRVEDTKKAGSPRTGQPIDQSLPFKREQWNTTPESGGNRGSRACTWLAGFGKETISLGEVMIWGRREIS